MMNSRHRRSDKGSKALFLAGLMALSLGSLHSGAQESDAIAMQDSSVATAAPVAMAHSPAIGITLGSSGLGIQGIYPLNNQFSLRAGLSWIPTFTYTRTDKVGTTTLEQKFKTGFVNIHLLGDYYLPVLQHTGFRVSAGLAWFVHAQSKVRSIPVGDYYYGDIQINDDRMGDINTTVKRNGIAPYLGAGFLNLFSSKQLQLSLDVGTYYLLPEASVKMETTGYLTGNERNQEQLKENLKGYRWLPVVQVGLYYKL
ncbi:hypothetical protein [Taibaiella koreensis]|uniref:hypothetical protein n=1 Tax=Taibaiella koreensis TaxID=1268548 RepID=UPI0013C317E6|nr:hypothetical protein [Taibaiella koreensis]